MTHGTGHGGRVHRDIERLAPIGRGTDGGISRPAPSPADLEAPRWLMGWMTAAGLGVTALFRTVARLLVAADGAGAGGDARPGDAPVR